MPALSGSPLFDYSGKTVVITGAASGMGAETLGLLEAEGASVHAIDIVPAASASKPQTVHHLCDLASKSSIEELGSKLPSSVDVVMNCAGVPNGGRFNGEQVMRINWLGLRHLTELLLPRIPSGGSVVHIASTAGRDWQSRSDVHQELMEASTFDLGLDWVKTHADVCGGRCNFYQRAFG